MEKSGNLLGCSGAPEWCAPQKITWQWKIDVPLSSFCGICSEGLLTMKSLIFHDFPCLWCTFTKGNWQIHDRGIHLKNPKPNQTHQEIPQNSEFQSSNPIKSYPPRGFPASICKPSQITSGHTWILRGLDRIAKVNDKELAEKCPGINVILGPGMKTRVDAWVFFPKHGGKRLVFLHNSYNWGSITLRMPTLLATITTRLVTFSGWGISISAFTCNECFQKSFFPLGHCKKPMNFRWSWPWSFLLSALVFIFDPSFPTIFDGLSKLVRIEVQDGW